MHDDPVDIPEETHMTQLIHLVISDGLYLYLLDDITQIVRRCRQRCYARARKCDLRCRGKLVCQVGIARPLTFCQYLYQMILIMIVEMMHRVGIVPHDPEVLRRGLEPCKAPYSLIRVGIARRIGILGRAPDALDGRIMRYQILDHIHIRAGRRHGYAYIFDAEIFRDGEMPVISGNDAQKLHLVQLAPRRIAHHTVRHASGDRIVHDIQRGVAVDDDILCRNLHHVRHQLLDLLYTGETAVVAAVGAVRTYQIRITVQCIQQCPGQIELLLARLAPAHVQMGISADIFVIYSLYGRIFLLQLLF